jgi:hypothetical protein
MTAVDEAMIELHRRAEITSKVRYEAARRLMAHNLFSQWTLAVLAVGQIAISVIDALDLPLNYSDRYLAFGGIFFGVLVLAYSLLLGMSNYSARSVQLHKCGLELGELARELYLISKLNGTDRPNYEGYAKKYYVILGQYENHEEIDYKRTKFFIKDGDSVLGITLDRIFEGARLKMGYFFGFSHYLITGLLMAMWLWLAIPKNY